MIVLIINIILCVISGFVVLYGYKRHIQATEMMKKADDVAWLTFRSWPRPDEGPLRYAIKEFGKDAVAVYSVFRTDDGHFCDVVVKVFPFDPTDSEDKAFAIREAEELIEKLREK